MCGRGSLQSLGICSVQNFVNLFNPKLGEACFELSDDGKDQTDRCRTENCASSDGAVSLVKKETKEQEDTETDQGIMDNTEVRAESADVKEEVKTESADVKKEVKTESADVTEEVKTESADVKEEVKTESVVVKEEVKTESAEVKEEVKTESAEVRADEKDVKAESENMESEGSQDCSSAQSGGKCGEDLEKLGAPELTRKDETVTEESVGEEDEEEGTNTPVMPFLKREMLKPHTPTDVRSMHFEPVFHSWWDLFVPCVTCQCCLLSRVQQRSW